MSVNPARKQLFELWRQSSLSGLTVSAHHLGLGDAVRPDTARALLSHALKSWDTPESPAD